MGRKASKARTFSNFISLRESGAALKGVPEETGGRTFKGVTIIKSGLGNRRDKNFYPDSTLRESVSQGMFEGLKAYADHPTSVDEEIQPERTVRDLVGIYTNSDFKEADGGGRITADLRILKSSRWLSDMIEELVSIGQSDKIGISINGRGQTVPHKMKMQESDGGEVEVNLVEKFVDLRSADVVTEAGAGGGFQQLLESAKTAKLAEERTNMDRKEILKALQEAAEAGDTAKVKELTAQLAKLEEVKEPVKKGTPAAETDEEETPEGDEVEEGDEGEDGEEGDGEDDDLEEAVQSAKDAADANEEGEQAADAEELDECGKKAKKKMTEKFVPFKKGMKGAFKKGGGKVPFKEADIAVLSAQNDELREEVARLTDKLTRIETRNNRLAEALRVREKADIARKALKESKIPAESRAILVDKLVGLPNAEAIQKEVRFYESLYGSQARRSSEEFDEVEGAGSRLRESYGVEDGDAIAGMLDEVGIPTKK
jgi:hypothetical protein